jgi:hypothetical protein
MIAANALVTLGLILLIGLLIYGPWQAVCTDYARQIVFEKRDAIFDLARDGKLSFNSSEYRTIRVLLERNIRFAHELTLPSFLVFWGALVLRNQRPRKPELQLAIERLEDSETREYVRDLVMQAVDALIIMMVFKSPITLICFLPIAILSLCAHLGRGFLRSIRSRSREIVQFEAERVGSTTDALAT